MLYNMHATIANNILDAASLRRRQMNASGSVCCCVMCNADGDGCQTAIAVLDTRRLGEQMYEYCNTWEMKQAFTSSRVRA